MAALTACGGGDEPGVIAPVEGFAGLVAGDEPRAVTIGRDIIGNGGSAADAAVAMYFAMTATLPSRVGIAGGGLCLVHNSGFGFQKGDPIDEVYAFLPDPATPDLPQLAGPRAMAVMHARHGGRRWEMLLIEAERLARLGHGVSRAFATDLAAAADFVEASPVLRRTFSSGSGALAREGEQIVQQELSGLIAGLRRQGAGYLYTGAFANRFVEAANLIGLPLTNQELREALPEVTPPLAVPYGDNTAYFPPQQGGATTAQLWAALNGAADYAGASPAGRAHLLAEAGQRVFAARGERPGGDGAAPLDRARLERLMAGVRAGQHVPAGSAAAARPAVSNPFTAGFVVADRWSSAVACSFTLHGLFGDGRVVPGTGVLLPKAPQPGADNLTAAIIANRFNGTIYFAGTASGGLAAPAALTRVMLESRDAATELAAAVAAPRVINVGVPDITYVEPSLPDDVQATLRQYGHALRTESVVGRANALNCPAGLRYNPAACQVDTDRRGYGLGVVVQ